MRIPGKDDRKQAPDYFVAAEHAGELFDDAIPRVERALGVEWYERLGNEADVAAVTLCRLRRARAGERGSPHHGDEAVRYALDAASPEALIWIASRAISYMDEDGFPEAVEPWLRLRDEESSPS
jgi:hypothetical protein